MRRYDDPPEPGRKYHTRPSVYAILPCAGGILTTYQDAPHFEFQLPGGGVDPGESLQTALHREVYEETGYHITPPRLFYRYRRFVEMPEYNMWAEKICSIFIARPTLKLGPPLENDHTPCVLSVEEAVEMLAVSADRQAVGRYFSIK